MVFILVLCWIDQANRYGLVPRVLPELDAPGAMWCLDSVFRVGSRLKAGLQFADLPARLLTLGGTILIDAG